MLLWFALFPVHPVMAVTTTKDIFFTAFAVLFLLRLSDILIPASPDSDERKEMAGSRARILFFLQRVLLSFDGVMMTLFRKNGLYMMLLLLVFLVISAAAAAVSLKRGRKDSVCLSAMAVFLLVMILVYKGTDAYLIKITNAGKGEAAEALSLPLQQIARAYKSGGNSLKEDDLNDVEKYISEFGLNQYRPSISDGVKQYFNNEEYAENRSEFFKVWLRIGIESPGAYAAAFLYQTMGAWYPDDVSHLEVYRDWWRNRVCYIVTDAEPVFVAYDFVERDNFAPAVRSFYEAICTDCVYRKIPLVKYLSLRSCGARSVYASDCAFGAEEEESIPCIGAGLWRTCDDFSRALRDLAVYLSVHGSAAGSFGIASGRRTVFERKIGEMYRAKGGLLWFPVFFQSADAQNRL